MSAEILETLGTMVAVAAEILEMVEAAAAETAETPGTTVAAAAETVGTLETTAAEIPETLGTAAALAAADAGWRCTATASGGPSGARPEDTGAGRNNRNKRRAGGCASPAFYISGRSLAGKRPERKRRGYMNRKKMGLMAGIGLLMAAAAVRERPWRIRYM